MQFMLQGAVLAKSIVSSKGGMRDKPKNACVSGRPFHLTHFTWDLGWTTLVPRDLKRAQHNAVGRVFIHVHELRKLENFRTSKNQDQLSKFVLLVELRI